jgi:exodeoxyribonuclease VII large subunit
MAQIISDKKVFSLSEVTGSIRKSLSERYTSTFWVKAEMNKLNFYKHSGHCYPELLEKKDGRVIAQMRSVLWSSDYIRINEQFLKVLKEPLKDGINILFEASISFDAVHGITLRIHAMEPTFTLGDLELEKSESIVKLQSEGLFGQNKQLPLPLLPLRIAVISVETSKGYADFCKTLTENPYGFRFFLRLYPALLQGEKAVPSILSQLERIQRVARHFDAVSIIRGGGGEVGLSCYNHYELAKSIATFPLPVLTGIGHATNITVSEMVSHTYGITPTAVAEVLLNRVRAFSEQLHHCKEAVFSTTKLLGHEQALLMRLGQWVSMQSKEQLRHQALLLERLSHQLSRTVSNRIQRDQKNLREHRQGLIQARILVRNDGYELSRLKSRLEDIGLRKLHEQQSQLQQIQNSLRLLDPHEVIKRGYSMTLHKGKVLTGIAGLRDGELIETLLPDGIIESQITHIKPTKS